MKHSPLGPRRRPALLLAALALTTLVAVFSGGLASAALASSRSLASTTSLSDVVGQVSDFIYLPVVETDAPQDTPTVTPTTTVADPTCVPAPQFSEPVDGVTGLGLSPYFRFQPYQPGSFPTGAWVVVEISPDSTFASAYQVSGDPTQDFVRLPLNLDPNQAYYWRAYLDCSPNGGPGPLTPTRTFATGPAPTSLLAAPTNLQPADGTIITADLFTLSWIAPSGANIHAVNLRDVTWEPDVWSFWWTPDPQQQMQQTAQHDETTLEWWVNSADDRSVGDPSVKQRFTLPARQPSASQLGGNLDALGSGDAKPGRLRLIGGAGQ